MVFEGRDAVGKGETIKSITQALNPRHCRVAALAAPTKRERTHWYFQRYVAYLPASGNMVLFDRSDSARWILYLWFLSKFVPCETKAVLTVTTQIESGK